jgi:hypothetical protein
MAGLLANRLHAVLHGRGRSGIRLDVGHARLLVK